jgi:hypothetical protein
VPRPPSSYSSTPYHGSYSYVPRPYSGPYNPGYRAPYNTVCRSGYGCRTSYNYRSPSYYGGYPYAWYPYYGWDSGSPSSSADYDSQQDALANEQRRNDELAGALADEQDRAAYYSQQAGAPQQESSGGRDDRPNTVLVFSNGTRTEIQNYAIMGDTLYDFSPQRTKKILLSQLDIYATIKANDDRGIEFRVPPKQQAQ